MEILCLTSDYDHDIVVNESEETMFDNITLTHYANCLNNNGTTERIAITEDDDRRDTRTAKKLVPKGGRYQGWLYRANGNELRVVALYMNNRGIQSVTE